MDESTRQATRLWALAQPAVSAFVTSVVRDFRDRDDVLQDIAVEVIESFARYDSQRPFVAWALGVARNQVGLYLRRRKRDKHVFDDEIVERLAIAFAEVGPSAQRKLDFLQDCLTALDGRARRLCELRYSQDLKPAAIASHMQMTANGVAKALQRIRDQLRDCLTRKSAWEGSP